MKRRKTKRNPFISPIFISFPGMNEWMLKYFHQIKQKQTRSILICWLRTLRRLILLILLTTIRCTVISVCRRSIRTKLKNAIGDINYKSCKTKKLNKNDSFLWANFLFCFFFKDNYCCSSVRSIFIGNCCYDDTGNEIK